jgi:hypothetical protein
MFESFSKKMLAIAGYRRRERASMSISRRSPFPGKFFRPAPKKRRCSAYSEGINRPWRSARSSRNDTSFSWA